MEGVLVRCKSNSPGLGSWELVFLLLLGVGFIPFWISIWFQRLQIRRRSLKLVGSSKLGKWKFVTGLIGYKRQIHCKCRQPIRCCTDNGADYSTRLTSKQSKIAIPYAIYCGLEVNKSNTRLSGSEIRIPNPGTDKGQRPLSGVISGGRTLRKQSTSDNQYLCAVFLSSVDRSGAYHTEITSWRNPNFTDASRFPANFKHQAIKQVISPSSNTTPNPYSVLLRQWTNQSQVPKTSLRPPISYFVRKCSSRREIRR